MKKKEMDIFLVGAIMGAFLGIMLTPKSGKRMRECFMDMMRGMDNDFKKSIKDLEQDIMELDKEKSFKRAKEKSNTIIKKADELVDSAVKNGNSKLKKMAGDVQKKANIITESVLDNLESQ